MLDFEVWMRKLDLGCADGDGLNAAGFAGWTGCMDLDVADWT